MGNVCHPGRGLLGALTALLLLAATPGTAQQAIFADGFESGDLSAWSGSREQVPGSLEVSVAAALGGSSFGLEIRADGQAYVDQDVYEATRAVLVRLLLNTNDLEIRPRRGIELMRFFAQGRRHHLRLGLRQIDSDRFAVVLFVRQRGGYEFVGAAPIGGGAETQIEIAWQAASTPRGGDGEAVLIVDGLPIARAFGLANGRFAIHTIRLGLLRGASSASGSFYLDDFQSFRTLAP